MPPHPLLHRETVSQLGVGRKLKPVIRAPPSWLGDREAAEEPLERNLLVNKILRLFTMQKSFSTIKTVTHNLQMTAILKLPKLALCPLSPQRGKGEGKRKF